MPSLVQMEGLIYEVNEIIKKMNSYSRKKLMSDSKMIFLTSDEQTNEESLCTIPDFVA